MKVTIDEKAKTVTVVAPLQKPSPSKSGKSLTIATSSGILTTDVEFNGQPVKVGLNVFVPA